MFNEFTIVYPCFSPILPSGKLTVRPWQSSGLEDEFQLNNGYFQGPTVNLPEGNPIHQQENQKSSLFVRGPVQMPAGLWRKLGFHHP